MDRDVNAENSSAKELKLLTTVAMKGVLDALAPEFKRRCDCDLAMTFGPGGMALDRVRAGHICDAVISAPPVLATLAREGHIAPGSPATIARSIIGVAVRKGAPKPAIDTVDDFKNALLAAKTIAYTDPATGAASGVHFAKIIERLGIAAAVKAKARLGGGGPVAELVSRGEAELAIQQICEHMLVPGVEVVGPLPEELQSVTTLAIGLHARAARPEAGRALIELLTSPQAQGLMREHGLEPAA